MQLRVPPPPASFLFVNKCYLCLEEFAVFVIFKLYKIKLKKKNLSDVFFRTSKTGGKCGAIGLAISGGNRGAFAPENRGGFQELNKTRETLGPERTEYASACF